VSPEKGERMWRALSERYFEGKHTKIHPIRLDNHALLIECAEEAGLDPVEAKRVLSTNVYEKEVTESVMAIQRSGVNSIPVLIFEAEGVEEPVVHHGSGSTAEFSRILLKLDAACSA
jgi:predicted DsbA family dithiol-disulfide isomerase